MPALFIISVLTVFTAGNVYDNKKVNANYKPTIENVYKLNK